MLPKLSYVEGPLEPPLSEKTLPRFFQEDILTKHAHRPALICPQEPFNVHNLSSTNLSLPGGKKVPYIAWNFEEFDRHIRALARGLIRMGVKKGDRVAVVMGNNSAYACLQWACASIGAILVTINPAYKPHELVATLNLVGVSTLFIVPRLRTSDYIRTLISTVPGLLDCAQGGISVEEIPTLKNLVLVDNAFETHPETLIEQFQGDLDEMACAVDFREIMVWREDSPETAARSRIIAGLNSDDIMNMQFTSGTTGMPKAVSLTHRNLLNNGLLIGRCMNFSSEDMLCNPTPLFHCFDESNLAAWTHGCGVTYPSQSYHPSSIVDAVLNPDFPCTALHGVPTHFLGVLSEIERRLAAGETLDFSRLRTGIAAGSPVPIELMKQLIDKLNLKELTIAYGMTETSPVSFQTVVNDPLIKKIETVGQIHPHVKAKIVDSEGNIVPSGIPGELIVSGYLLQKGYWNDSERTAEVMRKDENGTLWMHTGDEGIMDEEGYLRIVARIKDIIIRGGENLFPVQIENVITSHPRILEAAAVAVPDSRYGEVVGLWLVMRKGADHEPLSREAVRTFITERMNPQNAPAWVWIIGEDGPMDELPKTASGKVMKHVLRDWSKELAANGVGLVNK